MSAKLTPLSPWEDRWSAPTLEQLLKPVDENRHKQITALIERISAYEGIAHELVWHGNSWRWTLQITLETELNKLPFAYIVPVPEAPILCFPMSDETVNRLPLKRLNRYIRDGIRGAKCAVDTHWAKWTPSAGTEVEHLMDLVKRLHKIYNTVDVV